jgi:Ca-activated chloride channel family protein
MTIEAARETAWQSGLRSTQGVAVPLDGVAIEGEVLGGHAHVRVRQTYVNVERAPIESVYTFPLPSDATLTGFRMECEGQLVEGVVREREQAFRAYDDAVLAGHGAALLDQERNNVFTATVGNLLPGERTVIEVTYVQRVALDEGSMRVMIPTLVAPRYIPGAPAGPRTAHGSHDPTTRVPDADRITPPIGRAPYRVTLDLLLDLGRAVQVRSPSHPIAVRSEGSDRARVTRVTFARDEEPLDRDLVLEVRGAGSEQLAAVCAHKPADGDGFVALSVLPDLLSVRAERAGNEVTFLIDTSGSMEGASIEQARAALRLCLRHLRAGDRFNVVAFASGHQAFSSASVPFSQRSMEQADAWVARLRASGGTELLAPMTEAATQNPHGILVLLTDGQVGNENEIAQAVLTRAKGLRVYSFGIGTNVSDQLLRELARATHGAVEFIHPGERIEEKVVSVFARAIAPRVREVSVRFEGVEVGEFAPSPLGPIVDGEPWVLFGRYAHGGTGKAILRGTLHGEPWELALLLELPARCERPAVAKLWASERIRDFEAQRLEGRRADAMRARIIELSTTYGVGSAYTSFVVIERRTGDRRVEGAGVATRVVPVHAPAGWSVGRATLPVDPFGDLSIPSPRAASAASYASVAPSAMVSSALPMVRSLAAPAAPAPVPGIMARVTSMLGLGPSEESGASEPPAHAKKRPPPSSGAPSADLDGAVSPRGAPSRSRRLETPSDGAADEDPAGANPSDPASVMARQLASGLWSEQDDVSAVRETARALHALLDQRITTAHPMYGTPVKKAVEALLRRLPALGAAHRELAAFALGVAWRIATGPRTRAEIEDAARAVPECAGRLGGDETALARWLSELAARV